MAVLIALPKHDYLKRSLTLKKPRNPLLKRILGSLFTVIQTRFFSPKLKQIRLSFMSFPISFISFSYRVLTYLSSVAVALPCMYYIREEVKSEDFI